jgi:hypothetical protein
MTQFGLFSKNIICQVKSDAIKQIKVVFRIGGVYFSIISSSLGKGLKINLSGNEGKTQVNAFHKLFICSINSGFRLCMRRLLKSCF